MSAPNSGEVAVPRTGDEVVYLERVGGGGLRQYKAQVVSVHHKAYTPPRLDLACCTSLGRVFARMRVAHESLPGESHAWRHVT